MNALPKDSRGDLKIAGTETVDDWKKLCAQLVPGQTPDLWKQAFKDFYRKRIETRYFNPIEAIEGIDLSEGEGFSIVAIQCSLIEFLESTMQGKTYTHWREGDPALADDEYSNSSGMFVAFLSSRAPFNGEFSKTLAGKFYSGVRCGLLHEARTKEGWSIKKGRNASTMINRADKIIYRIQMQKGFKMFLNMYKADLATDAKLQEAFVRKINSLCVE